MASSITSLKASVWDCLARAPLLRPIAKRVKDSARNLSFQLRSSERAASLLAYQQCQNPKDFFAFASTLPYVKPHQLATEIIAFLNFAASRSPLNVCEIG